MKKALKVLVIIIGALSLMAVVFFFWGSGGQGGEPYQLKTYDNAAVSKDTLSVMTYNIGYLSGMNNNQSTEMPPSLFGRNLEHSQQLIRQHTPDIVGFQEIDFASARSHDQNQLDSLADGYHQAYTSVNWNKNYVPFPYWPPQYHFGHMLSGQAILSKFPISNAKTEVLEKPVNAPFYYNAFYLDRLIQIVDISVGKHKIKVMNLHLEAFDTETREMQADVVRKIYEKYASQMPVILMGDFNSEPYWEEGADEVMRTILTSPNIQSAVVKKAYEANPKAYYTFNSGTPFQRIDYILYNDNFITPISADVLQEAGEISDHFPVVFRFTFKSPEHSKNIE